MLTYFVKLLISFSLFQLTAYFMVHSWLFTEVCMSPVKFNELSDLKQTFDGREVQSDILNPFNNTESLTATAKNQSEGMDNDDIFSRFTRSINRCELKRERKWNRCLGKFFTKVHCRTKHVTCLPYKAPPHCKKVHHIVFGENGQACHVVKSCTCA